MKRRTFLASAFATAAGLSLPAFARKTKVPASESGGKRHPAPSANGPWKSVEITTKVEVQGEAGGRIWLPMPRDNVSYQEHSDTLWNGNFSRAGILRDGTYGERFFYAEWDKAGPCELAATYRVKLRDRSGSEAGTATEASRYLSSGPHLPLDGVVLATAGRITKGEKNADRKARLIYDWMVENTSRDSSVRGCGQGDVKSLLESNAPKGKCVDLSSLFVALCRASGIPAREVFGLRVLPSKLSKSIGKEGDVTGGQHCRAEYFSANRGGWMPVDPADVRKVILEENLGLETPHVSALRRKLFGFWEMNWVAFNSARDFALPPSPGTNVNYLMYPFYAAGGTTKDGMDPKAFQYTIHAREA